MSRVDTEIRDFHNAVVREYRQVYLKVRSRIDVNKPTFVIEEESSSGSIQFEWELTGEPNIKRVLCIQTRIAHWIPRRVYKVKIDSLVVDMNLNLVYEWEGPAINTYELTNNRVCEAISEGTNRALGL